MLSLKKLYFIFLSTFLFINVFGQDVIVTSSGNSILSNIVNISNDSIKYKKWTNQNGPIYIITCDEVFFIEYQNGEKIIFNKPSNNSSEDFTNTIKGSNYNTNDLNKANYNYKISRLNSKAKGNRIIGYVSVLVGIGGGVALSSIDDAAGWICMGTGVLIGGAFTIRSIMLNNKAQIIEQEMNQKLYSINIFDRDFSNGNNINSYMSICKDKKMNTKTFSLNLSYIF